MGKKYFAGLDTRLLSALARFHPTESHGFFSRRVSIRTINGG